MIIKSKSIKNAGAYSSIISYILREDAQYTNAKGERLFYKHNILGKPEDISFLTKQFLENLEHRKVKRSDNISILHEILSFHPDDAQKVTLDTLKDITKKYIQERNPSGVFIASAHGDKDHVHIHVVGSPVEFKTGKSMRVSKKDFGALQERIQAYQQEKFPELGNSVINYRGHLKKKKEPKDLTRLEQIRNLRLRKD